MTRLRNAGLQFKIEQKQLASDRLTGKTFVISGTFVSFSRDSLKSAIQENGGKVVSSISSNLNYLIAGDKMGPAKLKKANDLEVKIISEDEFKLLIR